MPEPRVLFFGELSSDTLDVEQALYDCYGVMINSLDNQPFGNFEMTWRAADKMLILDDGKWIWSLKLVSLNACGEH